MIWHVRPLLASCLVRAFAASVSVWCVTMLVSSNLRAGLRLRLATARMGRRLEEGALPSLWEACCGLSSPPQAGPGSRRLHCPLVTTPRIAKLREAEGSMRHAVAAARAAFRQQQSALGLQARAHRCDARVARPPVGLSWGHSRADSRGLALSPLMRPPLPPRFRCCCRPRAAATTPPPRPPRGCASGSPSSAASACRCWAAHTSRLPSSRRPSRRHLPPPPPISPVLEAPPPRRLPAASPPPPRRLHSTSQHHLPTPPPRHRPALCPTANLAATSAPRSTSSGPSTSSPTPPTAAPFSPPTSSDCSGCSRSSRLRRSACTSPDLPTISLRAARAPLVSGVTRLCAALPADAPRRAKARRRRL